MEPPLRSFDQESLTAAEEISLYSELIRVVEKDIDSINSKDTRNGLSIWGIVTAMVASIVYLLGQTRELSEVPGDAPEIACVSIIFLYLGWFVVNVLSGTGFGLKPGRLMAPKEFLKGRIFFLSLRFSILLLVSYVLIQTDFVYWTKVVSIALVFIPIMIGSLSFIALSYTKRPFGNNPKHKRSASGVLVSSLLCYFISVVVLGSQLHFPVGHDLSDSYIVGITVSSIIFLFELLLSMASGSSGDSKLADFRDDLILREMSLNEALNRYKILREGKSFLDEMKPDYDRIIQRLNQPGVIFDEQIEILGKVENVLPKDPSDPRDSAAIKEEVDALISSFQIHRLEIGNSFELMKSEWEPFYEKLRKSAEATGDYETEHFIRRSIDTAVASLVQKEQEVNQKHERLVAAMKKLVESNSEIPL